MPVLLRLAVAAMAGVAVAAATGTTASSQNERQAPAPDAASLPAAATNAASPPALSGQPVARVLPHDEAGADLETLVAARSDNVDQIDDETRCMAKVVHHEAANQPLRGQLAVAEVIVHRTRSARFPSTPCAVANQRGQFSHIASYRAPTSSGRWRTAVAISRLAQSSAAPEVVPGALFFHASYVRPAWRHRLVTRIGDQVFYR